MALEFITRKGCHLCEAVLAELRLVGIDPTLIDIDEDAVLLPIYDFRVPVLLLDGRVVGEGLFDESWLEFVGPDSQPEQTAQE